MFFDIIHAVPGKAVPVEERQHVKERYNSQDDKPEPDDYVHFLNEDVYRQNTLHLLKINKLINEIQNLIPCFY